MHGLAVATQGGGFATGRGPGCTASRGNKDKWQLEAWQWEKDNVLAVLLCPLVPLLQLGAIAEAVRRHAPGVDFDTG